LHALDEPLVNFIWLEDFLALAATGNFSRAAEDRHSSQPAFSRRIRALEEWIGAPLVDRSTHPARLTEVGEWFRGAAEDILARTARLPGEAREVAEASSVTLSIASTHALSFAFLPRWLRGLESTLTLGPVKLMSDVLAGCEAQMQQGKVHFVLTHAHAQSQGSLDSHGYLCATIGRDQLIPVSKPTSNGQPLHRLGTSPPGGVPVLAYTDESGLGRILRSVLGRRLESSPIRLVFTAHLASVLRSMALDGRGIAWLPRSLVEEDLEAGRLVAAADAGWSVDLEIRLYRPREVVGKAAEAFWESATQADQRAD
jgi:LysR family transcriptional regulator, hypochlorite-specific transcription factor HypT